MKEICFYHSADLDGHCSGAIIKKAIPDVELVGIDYGDEFPWDKIDPDTTIYMVDFSLQPFDLMIKLNKSCKKLIWIDHHKSAIEEFQKSKESFYGMRETGKAACELCWEYFFIGGDIPESITLLGRYDIWDNSDTKQWEDVILPFQFGMRINDTIPENNMPFWEEMIKNVNNQVDMTIQTGVVILLYQKQYNQKYMSSYSFESEFEGLKGICVNKGVSNSQLFDSVYDPQKHDIMITFCRLRDGRWTVSLYSDKGDIDVSIIAKKYGGGGHKGASGFQCDTLPF